MNANYLFAVHKISYMPQNHIHMTIRYDQIVNQQLKFEGLLGE